MFHHKHGGSLLNVLVVVVLCGIAVVLVLPALQGFRHRARRSGCSNNLKQLVLATHRYHDARHELPPAYLAADQPSTASWLVHLLPYMELQETYERLRENVNQVESTDAWALELHGNSAFLPEAPLSGLVCPDRRGPMLSTSGSITASPTDYCAVNSTTSCWFGSPEHVLANGSIIGAVQLGPRGKYKSSTSFGAISDGLSYTAMLGEKHFHRSWKFGNVAQGDGPGFVGGPAQQLGLFHSRRLGGTYGTADCPANQPAILLFQDNQGEDGQLPHHYQAFGSIHPLVCQFGMGDGSVQQISVIIDPKTLAAMGGRDDELSWTIP